MLVISSVFSKTRPPSGEGQAGLSTGSSKLLLFYTLILSFL